jgi:hypothetical protein
MKMSAGLKPPSSRSKGSSLRRLPRREQIPGRNLIGDRSDDRARDQEANGSSQVVATLPPRRRKQETLASERRRHREDLPPATGTFGGDGRKPGDGRQLDGAREAPNLFPPATADSEPGDQALALEPRDAGFQPLQIVVAGLAGARLHGRRAMPEITCPGRWRAATGGIQGIIQGIK